VIQGLRIRMQQLMKLRGTRQRDQAQPQGDRPTHPNCPTPGPPIPDSAFRYQAWVYDTRVAADGKRVSKPRGAGSNPLPTVRV